MSLRGSLRDLALRQGIASRDEKWRLYERTFPPREGERFVIADRDIHTALRTGFPVSYGEVRLGPDGPLPGIQTRHGR